MEYYYRTVRLGTRCHCIPVCFVSGIVCNSGSLDPRCNNNGPPQQPNINLGQFKPISTTPNILSSTLGIPQHNINIYVGENNSELILKLQFLSLPRIIQTENYSSFVPNYFHELNSKCLL